MYEFKDPITKEEISYHIDKKILYLLDKIKDTLTKKDKDYVMLMDGYEGSGKSTFAIQMGKYVDPTLNLSRVCMTADEFKQAIINAKKGECVIYDEAVTGLSAGSAITKIGRLIKGMMMQMRQKNLFVIVILPIVFEFNRYAVLSRARFFLHVYETGGRMGYFVGYNKKDTRETYLRGKKTHSYKVRSRFTGRFYGKFGLGKEIELLYRKKKEETLFMVGEEEEEGTMLQKLRKKEKFLLKFINEGNKEGKTYEEIIKAAKEDGVHYSMGDLSNKIMKTAG